MERMFKSKTFWTGISTMIGAGAAWATGDVSGPAAVQLAVTGALGVFLRMGLGKIEAKLERQF